MAAKRKVSWEPRARKAEKDLHRMERLRAELSTTLELVTRERDALLAANTELQAVAKAAQETAQTYAHRFHQMEDKNVELDAEADRLKRTDTELREEVRRLRKEAADHPAVVGRMAAELKKAQDQLAVYQLTTTVEDAEEYLAQELKAEQEAHALTQEALGKLRERMKREAKTPQTAPQTAPQTCRCSEHEERLRALLERVVSLESRMDAVSAASRLRRLFEGGG